MEHLVDMKQVTKRIIILATERKHGLIHPTQGDPYFQCNVYDGLEFEMMTKFPFS